MPDFPRSRLLERALAAAGAALPAQPLAGDGSDRSFFRLAGAHPVILLYHPDPPGGTITENDSYFLLGRHLRGLGVPVPEIYTYCREEGWMLLEDLGDLSLEAAIRARPEEEQIRRWYVRALEVLVHQQFSGRVGFDPSWCFDTAVVDQTFLGDRECGYFVREFLNGYLGLKIAVEELTPDFRRLVALALPPGPDFFLHRDFQSRNLFLKEGKLRVIDFQGGRLGPLGYDVAALLIDPYVALAPHLQAELLTYYQELLGARIKVPQEVFREQYSGLALSRNLQILGAFGFLTRVKRKAYFERYIPAALAGLKGLLQERAGDFPRLERIIGAIE